MRRHQHAGQKRAHPVGAAQTEPSRKYGQMMQGRFHQPAFQRDGADAGEPRRQRQRFGVTYVAHLHPPQRRGKFHVFRFGAGRHVRQAAAGERGDLSIEDVERVQRDGVPPDSAPLPAQAMVTTVVLSRTAAARSANTLVRPGVQPSPVKTVTPARARRRRALGPRPRRRRHRTS